MKKIVKTMLLLLLAFSGSQLAAQENREPVSAFITLLKSPTGKTFAALGFKNNSNRDIFLGGGMLLSYLASDNGSYFSIYKNNKYFPNYLDSYGTIEKPTHKHISNSRDLGLDTPPLNVLRILRNKYLSDSIGGKDTTNEYIARQYFKEENENKDDMLSNFIKGDCLFLKAHASSRYFFVLDITELLKDTVVYTIKYEPGLKEWKPRYPELNKILSYERIYPTTIQCNTLSVNADNKVIIKASATFPRSEITCFISRRSFFQQYVKNDD